MATFVFSRRSPLGRSSVLAMLLKRRYRLHPGHALSPSPEAAPVVVDPVMEDVRPGAPRPCMRMDSDLLCAFKPATDVLVRGHAWSPRGAVQELWCGVSAGSARKALRVTGDRRILIGRGGQPSFTRPLPFERMPLSWDRAFGGWDDPPPGTLRGTLFPAEPVTYPRNPFGRGFFLDRDRGRAHDAPAPNLDDPDDPVTPERMFAPAAGAWLDLPMAACFEPIDWGTFPRSAFGPAVPAEVPVRPVAEVRMGACSQADAVRRGVRSLDPRIFNCAPAGLARVRLHGGERVVLWHLHRSAARVEFDVPRERPRLYLKPQGCRAYELAPQLQTVLIEPDEDRVTLTWSGTLEVAAPYPEEMCKTMERAVRWER